MCLSLSCLYLLSHVCDRPGGAQRRLITSQVYPRTQLDKLKVSKHEHVYPAVVLHRVSELCYFVPAYHRVHTQIVNDDPELSEGEIKDELQFRQSQPTYT